MKKAIMLVGLLLGMVHTVLAEECGVFMEFFLRMNPEKGMAVNRAPMRLPVYVAYDTDTHKVKVVGRGAMEGKVFLYNINGALEGYSSLLNTDFTIQTSGTYIIQIQGDGWYAKGEITL